MVNHISKKIKKVGRIINRSKVNRSLYNQSFCNDITNKTKLQTKFNNLEEMINISKTTRTPLINIVPYCGEKVKVSKILDKVNESAIELKVVKSIETSFKATIISKFIDSGITKTDSKYVSLFNVEKFRDLIENKDKLDMILNDKKHACLVVHSNFMKDFTELYGNLTKFDNLDMIHMIIPKNNRQEPLLYIRKFSDYYKKPLPINTEIPYKNSLLEECTNLFLMRHCIACHNIIDKVLKSRVVGHIVKKLKGELGFSLYSICSPYTITELIDRKHALLELFNTTCGSINNIQFGSSVILRAILTSVLISKILTSKTTNITN